MALDPILTDILIEGNTIDIGSYPGNTYGFGSGILTTASAVIKNNYIGGVTISANSERIVVALSGSCIITGNTIVRGSLPIVQYIFSNSAYDQYIVGNIFDGYTIDNISNENLVAGLTQTSTYQSNKNQTSAVGIIKSPYLIKTTQTTPASADSGASYGDILNFSGPDQPTIYEGLSLNYNTTSGTPTASVYIKINLENHLPKNVQILNVVIGLAMLPGIAGQYNDNANLYTLNMKNNSDTGVITQYPQVTSVNTTPLAFTMVDTLSRASADIAATASSLTTQLTNVPAATLQTKTQYLVLDATAPSVIQYYNTGTANKITVAYTASIALTGTGFSRTVLESPLMVRFRW